MSSAFYINIDPIIFRIGPLAIGWYGIMVALAVITVVSWVAWQAKKTNAISSNTIFMGALIGIPSGVVFSKLLHVIDQWSFYIHNPGRILSGEGLTIWGAVLGAALGIWIYSKVSRGFRFTLLGDMIAPGIILAQAIGRVGCTLNGCCYGLESNAPCAVIYTNPNSFAPVGIAVLPTQIFEIGYDLLLFGLLLFLKGKLKPEGSLFVVYFAFYGAWRFGIEFIREGTPFVFGMHQAQFIGLMVMLITIPLLIWRTRWAGRSDDVIEELKKEEENAK
jgi:phosphatidylglycerol:prolipoprotein diacylglycerol transferase